MRPLLARTLAIGAALVLAGAVAAGVLWAGADVSTVGEPGFDQELKVPPLLEPHVDGAGRKVFDLELQTGTSELLPGRKSPTWGANGSYLGPTLRASRGDDVRINVGNGLPETTTLHWHGMHLPAKADGGPHQPIEPGGRWSPEWAIDQPAASLWYHPHLHGRTAEHVYRGIAGMFILDDPEAQALPLPKEYGVDDVPLVVQDKRFNDDGSLDSSPSAISPTGLLGSDILVNGTHEPHLEIGDSRVRFRLVNASNARVYNFGFADDRPFELIATDGGLLEASRPMNRIQLSPGERAEMVAEFEPGEEVVLRSFEPELGTNPFEGRFAGADDSFDVLEIRAAQDLRRSPTVPRRLVGHEPLRESDTVKTRRFTLAGQSWINGRPMDMHRVDEAVELETTEIWEVQNASGTPHSFHIHDVRFRVLEQDGRPSPPSVSGLKDTVYVPPGETVRLLTQFNDYADPAHPYMFHCHVLQHEDRGMMGQFVVVKPGQSPRPPPRGLHADRGR